MSDGTRKRSEPLLAGLLGYGVWIACAIVTAGLVLGPGREIRIAPQAALRGQDLAKAGVALIILLPIARVALMTVLFLKERDYVYTAISALVLAIIGAGILVST